MNMINFKAFQIIKQNKTRVAVLVAVLALGAYFLFFKGDEAAEKGYTVSRFDLKEEVSITGKVKPSKKVDLAFDKGGRVGAIYKEVGDKILAGETIAALSAADIRANLLQAQASLESERAKLEEYKKGSRPEEIALAEAKVSGAEKTLEDAKRNLIDQISDAYTKSDDAVRYKADQVFDNPRSPNPQVAVSIPDANLEAELELSRLELEGILVSWQTLVSGLNESKALNSSADTSNKNISKVRNFMDKVSFLVNDLTPGVNYTQTTVDGWKSTISTARTNVNTAVSNLSVASEKLSSAESNLATYKLELELKKAGYTEEQIATQEAKVRASEASVMSHEAELAKTVIRSPISGVVSRMDARLGETVSAGAVLAAVIGESKFEIESNVAEVDIGKIKIGNGAKVTLDAYGDEEIFGATVSKIDPAETIIDNVPTYKVTFQFDKNYEKIRSGMTANIDILTKEKKNALALPRETVFEDGLKRFVNLKTETGEIKETEIKTGIRDQNGNIEILEGLKEGDRVIVPATR